MYPLWFDTNQRFYNNLNEHVSHFSLQCVNKKHGDADETNIVSK